MSIVAGVLGEAGTDYNSRAPEFTPGIFGGVRVSYLLVIFVLCCVFVFCLYFIIIQKKTNG